MPSTDGDLHYLPRQCADTCVDLRLPLEARQCVCLLLRPINGYAQTKNGWKGAIQMIQQRLFFESD